jgi:deleted-in-malignant-brain-tumors protein 1
MAGAKCQIRTDCRDGDIRLAGVISNPLKGRVEICYDGVWGTTCNNPWNSLNAMVVCRQLGHATLGAGVSGVLGNGNGPILLHNVICSGSEYRLLDCSNQILTIPTCSRAAGVTCQPGCPEGEIRLVNETSYAEGRVEICLNNEWGTVCGQTWGTSDANVVCRQLGFSSGAEAFVGVRPFGEALGRIWLSNVLCNGSERALGDCTASFSGINNCTHAQDAGVRCQSGCHDGDVRLVEGSSLLEGRVEICMSDAWGTVCDDGWGITDAAVVCRQLGLPAAGAIFTSSAHFGQGVGLIALSNVQCSGTESKLVECPSGVISCSHNEDVGVRCQRRSDCVHGDVRLATVSNSLQGRVEVCYDGVWGTVCNSGWETVEARVVCRQLGYSTSGAAVDNTNSFGSAAGPVLLRYVACRGNEFKLLECGNTALDSSCSHSADAGVRCLPGCTEREVRLVGGANYTEGRVEICLNDEWGTVCDQMWDDTDVRIVCRQLGLATNGLAVYEAGFGEGTGRIWLDRVQCLGNERELMDCTASSSGMNTCTHARDVGVRCPLGCEEGQIRLQNGDTRYEGRVEICINSTWGTICRDGWSNSDARVVCRQLGFSASGSIPATEFGLGVERIVLNSIRCTGSEARLIDCDISGFSSCRYNQHAGVYCQTRGIGNKEILR